jgi:hypothetical protein
MGRLALQPLRPPERLLSDQRVQLAPLRATLVTTLAAWLCTAACTNVVLPPTSPAIPRVVYLLDHGRHASLVLPAAEAGVVRYSYGDWAYYAQRETGMVETSSAAIWSTQAALGRRLLSNPADSAEVRLALKVGIEGLYEIVVESDHIDQLRRRLDGLYRANQDSRIYNSAFDLEFVHHPKPYTLFHNSNRVIAEWLRELGCRVRGLLLFSNWKVRSKQENR